MAHQPEEAGAGAADTVVAAEPTLEERLSAAIDSEPQEEEKKPEEGEEQAEAAAEAETELTPEDVTEEDEAEAEAPPIAPPVSWSAEEKAEFADLPRKVQETLTRREAEREKGLQRAQTEASQTRATVEKEAVEHIQRTQQERAQDLQALLVEVPTKPSTQLKWDGYELEYDQQLEAHERALAHNGFIEQRIGQARQQAQNAANVLHQQALRETEAVLREKFPEYLDAAKGPELKSKLASTALELGYSQDQLANVDGNDILAMRTATDWRDKAAKYDKLMAQKMERVRAAKDLPRVSKPGVPQGKNAVANQRYQADREAMKKGDMDAAARAISRFI